MWFFSFYRLYAAATAGGVFYLLAPPSIGLGLAVGVGVRLMWFGLDRLLARRRVERSCRRHLPRFRQEFGPYGIRIANKAEREYRIRRSLAEVFDPNRERLKRTVEQLEALDMLFSAGLRPEGDQYLLHDLKLKYGRQRLEE